MTDAAVIDNDVRLHIYRSFLTNGVPPTPAETARSLSMTEGDAARAFQRLAEGRVIVLKPGTHDVLMAAPLSAVPTRYRVKPEGGREHYANCVWDAMGVFAMLGQDGDSTRRAPIVTSRRSCVCVIMRWCPAMRWSTSRFRRRIGGTTSSSREARCSSSGRKSTCADGVKLEA